MGTTLRPDDQKKLFYLSPGLKNRPIVILPAVDDAGQFHVWGFKNDGGLLDIKPLALIEHTYLARKAASDEDLKLHFLNLFFQKNTNAKVFDELSFIQQDIHNLAASLEKMSIFEDLAKTSKKHTSRFAETEVEYIFGLCRSIFDAYQRIAHVTWDGIRLVDVSVKKQSLPMSFADMVLKENSEVRSSEDLQANYGLPSQWASFYVQEAHFFKYVRRIRDAVHHKGLSIDYVYATDDGFKVGVEHKQFKYVLEHLKNIPDNGKLIPLYTIISKVVSETFMCGERFIEMISPIIGFSEDLAPGYHIYLRGPYLDRIKNIFAENA